MGSAPAWCCAKPQAVWIALFIVATVRAVPPTTQTATYHNPLPIDVADPWIIRQGDTFWLYGTSARAGFQTWSSPDLVHWEPKGLAFSRDTKSWGEIFFWAPCVIERRGTFYMYYSARGKASNGDHLRICVATSTSPAGPFKDVRAPLLEIGKSVIDADAFIDADGKAYLYYALDNSENVYLDPKTEKKSNQSHIYVVPLGDDLVSIAGSPTFCIRPDCDWEGDTVNEGPLVLKYKSNYILMYSAHAFYEPEYSVGYATAKSPLGPWTKAPDNPILKRTADISGPGHHCVIASPDGKELFCAYHIHKNKIPGGNRQLAIDRMIITDEPNGGVKVKIWGPTSTTQPAPSRLPSMSR